MHRESGKEHAINIYVCIYSGTSAVHSGLCFSSYTLKDNFSQRLHSGISMSQKARFIFWSLFLKTYKNCWRNILPPAPEVLFSVLCQKWCERGVKSKRWEHSAWLHFVFIPASHADPWQDTGAGFSLLPPLAPCAALLSYRPAGPRLVQVLPMKKGRKLSLSSRGDESVTLQHKTCKGFT